MEPIDIDLYEEEIIARFPASAREDLQEWVYTDTSKQRSRRCRGRWSGPGNTHL
jgi:hypothetical protein